jgi:hypothetical protein
MTGFGSRLKLAANGVYARTRPVSEKTAGDVSKHCSWVELSL